MKNNPLIDVAAILMCILAVIALGHYFEAKKQRESPHKVEQKAEPRPKIDLSRFETSVKHTE